jgi:hypothetical protein
MHNGLATHDNKNNRTTEVIDTYKICGAKKELVMHALVCCLIIQVLNEAMRLSWSLLRKEKNYAKLYYFVVVVDIACTPSIPNC